MVRHIAFSVTYYLCIAVHCFIAALRSSSMELLIIELVFVISAGLRKYDRMMRGCVYIYVCACAPTYSPFHCI